MNEEIQQQTEQEELFRLSTDFILEKKKNSVLPKPIFTHTLIIVIVIIVYLFLLIFFFHLDFICLKIQVKYNLEITH